MSFSSSRHLFILALRFRSSKGFVIFLYWWVRDNGTSESELGEIEKPAIPPSFCSGDESEDDGAVSRVVELTLGEKAEKELCQFMVYPDYHPLRNSDKLDALN